MSERRTWNSIRNVFFSVSSSLLILLVSFANRTIFIHMLSEEYLGLNGLFSNILSFLSLAELGIGSAVNYALYKPLKDKNIEKIRSLMKLYRGLYIRIGCVVLVIGGLLTPFLSFLIKDMPKDIEYIYLYYIMFVINSGISYFYTYKRSLIICDQKEYISYVVSTVFRVLLTVFQIMVLFLSNSYLLYLVTMIVCTICENIVISRKANQLYPFIMGKNIQDVSSAEKKEIFSNIYALIFHKIGAVVVYSTDNIIISKYVGLAAVGLYSNYTLIINSINSILGKIFNTLVASVGDLMVDDDSSHSELVFERILFADMWLYGFTAICFLCFIQPFISLWIGDSYLLDMEVLFLYVCSYYITGMRKTVWIFKDAAGIYRQDRYKPVIEAVLNIIFSIPLAVEFGVAGVLAGTIMSTMIMPFWFEGYVLFKECFRSRYRNYILRQGKYAFVLFIISGITYFCCSFFSGKGLLSFVIKVMLCVAVSNLCLFLIYHRTKEFKYYYNLIRQLRDKKYRDR